MAHFVIWGIKKGPQLRAVPHTWNHSTQNAGVGRPLLYTAGETSTVTLVKRYTSFQV